MASKHEKSMPREAGKAGEEIRFAVGQSSLGWILVASSEKGLVSILLGEDEHSLIEDLQRRFPDAKLTRGDRKDDEQRLKHVLDFAESPSLGLDFPLDIRGTEFQQKVWQAVRKIPVGETRSFTDIALKVAAPKAMRAVGNACSTNNLAIAIPCHRVLHNDGTLSNGYHWGNARQLALLDREAAAATERPSGSVTVNG